MNNRGLNSSDTIITSVTASYIFSVNRNIFVTFSDLTISNSITDGSFITTKTNATIIFNNCILNNNTGQIFHGGVGVNIDIINSKITNSKSTIPLILANSAIINVCIQKYILIDYIILILLYFLDNILYFS